MFWAKRVARLLGDCFKQLQANSETCRFKEKKSRVQTKCKIISVGEGISYLNPFDMSEHSCKQEIVFQVISEDTMPVI